MGASGSDSRTDGVYSNATHDVGITLGSESAPAYDMQRSKWDPNAPLGVAITLLGTRSAVIDCANANFAFTITGGALIGSAFSITGALSSLPSAACVCVCVVRRRV